MADTNHRSLLYGVIAIQEGLIDAGRFEKCLDSWMADPSSSLQEYFESEFQLGDSDNQRIDQKLDSLLVQIGDSETSINESIANSLSRYVQDDLLRVAIAKRAGSMTEDSVAPVENQKKWQPHHNRFQITDSHAKGGLGEVFVARDSELDRDVAFKQIRPESVDNPQLRARFLREAEITAKLEHPGIVPIYGAGQDDDGVPGYAMRLIRGKSLLEEISDCFNNDKNLEDFRRNRNRLIRRLIDVCHAIDYAHSRGVIHRDIKPSNIMLGSYSETLMVDWGLAKVSGSQEPEFNENGSSSSENETDTQPIVVNQDTTKTIEGEALGTPAYMSPEQAKGSWNQVSELSDIYGLGATLYTILTGKPPFNKLSTVEILSNLVQGNVESPGTFDKDTPKPLESICRKAMSFDQSKRYQSAGQMAADLEAWLDNEPVKAHPDSFVVRMSRWVSRNRVLVSTVVATLFVVLVSAIILATLLASKNSDLRQAVETAESQTRIANEQSELALETMSKAVREFQQVFENRGDPNSVSPEEAKAREKILKNAMVGLQRVSDQLKKSSIFGETLVVAHQDLGNLYLRFGEGDFQDARDKAKVEFEAALEVCQKWIDAEPDNLIAIRRYAETCSCMANYARSMGDVEADLKWKKASIDNARRLAQSEQQKFKEVGYHLLWNTYFDVGTTEFRRFNLQPAISWYQSQLDLLNQIGEFEDKVIDDWDRDVLIPEVKNRLAIMEYLPAVRQDIEKVNQADPQLVPRILYDCAAWLASDGDHAAAFPYLERMGTMELQPNHYYNNACGYARCAKALLRGRQKDKMEEGEQKLFAKYLSSAIKTLETAQDKGVFDHASQRGLFGRDIDFESIRQTSEFQAFATRLREKYSPKN